MDAIVADRSQAEALVLAVLATVLGLLRLLPNAANVLSVLAGSAAGRGVLGWAAVAGILLAIACFYIVGFVVNAMARALGGSGTAPKTRLAIAWGFVPSIVAAAALLAVSAAMASAGQPATFVVIAAVISAIANLWSLVLAMAMLAHVHGFARWRAWTSYFCGAVGVALVLALGVRTFAYQTFYAPSGSMIPTLQIGDFFAVSKSAYGYSRHSVPFSPALFEGRIFARAPERGDVVVFRKEGTDIDYIKRIVGLPGDKVQMVKGRLVINGTVCLREETAKITMKNTFGQDAEVPTYFETCPGGRKHLIVEISGDRGPLDNTDVFETPAGAYFVLGDNRDNSTDSRVPQAQQGVGFVKFEYLIGRASFIYYSAEPGAAPAPPTLHPERIGLGIE